MVGCLLAPVSVLAVWTANQVSSTSRYVANVEPLVHDPAVQNALTDKLTTEITTHLNVTAYTDQAASLLTSHGLPRVGALLQTFGPSIALAALIFVFWGQPSAALVITLVVLLLVVLGLGLGLIELIGSRPHAEPASSSGPSVRSAVACLPEYSLTSQPR